MKRIGYINALRIKGKLPNVVSHVAVKRELGGTVVLTSAPNTKSTVAGGTKTTMSTSVTLGVTGTGGRNYMKGVFSAKGAGKQTLTVSVKTTAGTQKLTSATGTPTANTTTTVSPLPMGAPITVILKAKGATSVKTLIAKTLSVNATTMILV